MWIASVFKDNFKIKYMEQNRRSWLLKIGLAFTGIGLAKFRTFASPERGLLNKSTEGYPKQSTKIEDNMKLGAFSISLNVRDIVASKQFYENLGFKVLAGDLKKNY